MSEQHGVGCRCAECKADFIEAVFAQVPELSYSSTGAVMDRLHMKGVPATANHVREALWSLQRKPDERVKFIKKGVGLFWKKVAR